MTAPVIFRQFSFLLLSICFLALYSCKKKTANAGDLPLGWTAVNIDKYVSEYSPLRISSRDAIMVRFSKIPDQFIAQSEMEANGIASIDPITEGKWIWKDAVTLEFQPKNPLVSNQRYEIEIQLDKIFKGVPAKEASAILALATYQQQLTISHEGIEYQTDGNGNAFIQVKGWINALDDADAGVIEKAVSAVQDNNNQLKIRWEHTNAKEHIFYISGISRTAKESELQIKYDATELDDDFKGVKSLKVVSINDFVFLESKVQRDGAKSIDLIFSDPLDEGQILDGIIQIKEWNEKIPSEINGNRITLYLEQYPESEIGLTISEELKNKNGKNLGTAVSQSLSFTPANPEVKALRKGVIMPETENIWFPFQAINLKNVEIEISKIYQNNVLQFLQYNALDQHYDLTPVAKIIYTGKVDLTKISPANNEEKWQKYTLDLSKMVNVDPGSIYNVEIRFSKEDVLRLDCNEPVSDDTNYGDSYYDEGYDDGNNPCKSYYYYGDHYIRTNIFSSNIGLLAKGSGDAKSWTIFVNDLISANGMSGAEVSLFDFQKQAVGKGATDGNGLVTVECTEKPSFIMAKKDGRYGYLSLLDQYANPLSDFDVNGKQLKDGLDAFIYGERGVYRPGDSMFVSIMLFQHGTSHQKPLAPGIPVKLQVEDSRGKIQYEKMITENIDHLYHCKISTSSQAPTGNWKWIVSVGGETFYKSVKVETVKPNRLKIRYENLVGPLNLFKEPNLTFESTWLHGATAAGLKANVEVIWSDRIQEFKNHRGYKFEDPARSSDYYPEKMYEGNLNDQGSASYVFKQNNDFKPASGLKAGIKTTVFEKSGNFSQDYATVDVNAYSGYVGIKVPESEWGGHYLKSGISQSFSIVALDPAGKPLANRELNVGLYKAEWNWWYNESNYNLLKFNSADHVGAIKTARIKTNGKGEAVYTDEYEDYGNFLIRVCDDVSGHCTGELFYTSKWGNPPSHGESAQIIKLTADKESYSIGEKIKLRVPSNEKSKILLSIEQGNQLIKTMVAAGKSKETIVEVPVTADMAPNIYLHLSLIQPYDQTSNGLPLRMYGVLPVKINDPARQLNPILEVPASLKPDETFTIKVKEKQNKPMAYTLAIVDEGLLDLTRFKTPDPLDHFFSKISLGLNTWDLFDKVMNPYGQEFENLFTVGGDADALNLNSVKKANRFVPTVRYLGPFESKGQAMSHQIKIEKYVGAVRVMIVARNGNAFGKAEETRQVKKDLMVQTTLPRILAPGDEFDLGANIFSMVKNLGKVDVSLEADKHFLSNGNKSQSLQFSREEDILASFGVKVGNIDGIALIGAVASNARLTAKDKTEIEIRNPNLPETRVREYKIEAGQKVNLPIELFGSKGSHGVQLEVSNMLPVNLQSRLQYLIQYPYGCIEQTTSAAFPQLYVGEIMHLTPKRQKEVNNNISKAIQRITTFQTSNGGFSYWPGNNQSEDWASSYAGHFLMEAKQQNYFVSEKMINAWYVYQRNIANKYSTQTDANHTAQAYRLYTLAKFGKPEAGAMNRLRQAKSMTSPATYLLAAAYALSGKSQVAKELLTQAQKLEGKAMTLDYDYISYTYASPLRDLALKAEAQMQSGMTGAALTTIKSIVQELNRNDWYNTQALSHALLVVEKFYKSADKKGLLASVQYNGKLLDKISTAKSMALVDLPLVENGVKQTLTFGNETKGPVYVKIVTKGTPSIQQGSSPNSKNIQLKVNYLDSEGRQINPDELNLGQNFTARVTITNPGTFGSVIENCALTFQLPAGWEVSNNRLLDIVAGNRNYEYQDIRDDRVITFLDLYRGASKVIEIPLIAAYTGNFYQAPISIEAMYNNEIFARTGSGRVTVKANNIDKSKLTQ